MHYASEYLTQHSVVKDTIFCGSSYGHDSYFQSELNWTVIYLEIGFTNSGLISEGHFLCPGK